MKLIMLLSPTSYSSFLGQNGIVELSLRPHMRLHGIVFNYTIKYRDNFALKANFVYSGKNLAKTSD
jgi:hypothetical protein